MNPQFAKAMNNPMQMLQSILQNAKASGNPQAVINQLMEQGRANIQAMMANVTLSQQEYNQIYGAMNSAASNPSVLSLLNQLLGK